jgi:hypothetical protein
VPLRVDVGVVGDVEHDLDDLAAGELELGLVLGADGVAAVVADAQALSGEGVAAALGRSGTPSASASTAPWCATASSSGRRRRAAQRRHLDPPAERRHAAWPVSSYRTTNTFGAPSGALSGRNALQSGFESRMSRLMVPLNCLGTLFSSGIAVIALGSY